MPRAERVADLVSRRARYVAGTGACAEDSDVHALHCEERSGPFANSLELAVRNAGDR